MATNNNQTPIKPINSSSESKQSNPSRLNTAPIGTASQALMPTLQNASTSQKLQPMRMPPNPLAIPFPSPMSTLNAEAKQHSAISSTANRATNFAQQKNSNISQPLGNKEKKTLASLFSKLPSINTGLDKEIKPKTDQPINSHKSKFLNDFNKIYPPHPFRKNLTTPQLSDATMAIASFQTAIGFSAFGLSTPRIASGTARQRLLGELTPPIISEAEKQSIRALKLGITKEQADSFEWKNHANATALISALENKPKSIGIKEAFNALKNLKPLDMKHFLERQQAYTIGAAAGAFTEQKSNENAPTLPPELGRMIGEHLTIKDGAMLAAVRRSTANSSDKERTLQQKIISERQQKEISNSLQGRSSRPIGRSLP